MKKFECRIRNIEENRFEDLKDVTVVYDDKGIEVFTKDGYILDNYELNEYIGLKDKSGNKIYEGDIVEFIHSGEVHISEIYYKDLEGFYFKFRYSNDDYIYEMSISDLNRQYRETKVIGNVYDNIDILEVKHNGNCGC